MNASRLLVSGLLGFAVVAREQAAEEPEPQPKTHMRELLRARIAEDAKKAAAAKPATTPQAAPATATTPETPAPGSAGVSPASAETGPDARAPASPKKTAEQPATVMPKVEVKKDRITVLDQKLAKQDEEIAREKKNTKSTELDTALNDSKIAKPLAIFGGDSAQFRKRVASERVELMEAEKDVIEAIARAKTKKEKADLQKQLDELRAMRRELEKALR